MKLSKVGSPLADELIESLKEGFDMLDGRTPPSRFYPAPAEVDVKAIRAGTGLSQAAFAQRFGFTAAAVREWEQGRRRPEQAARVLLLVIAQHPEMVAEVIKQNAMRAA